MFMQSDTDLMPHLMAQSKEKTRKKKEMISDHRFSPRFLFFHYFCLFEVIGKSFFFVSLQTIFNANGKRIFLSHHVHQSVKMLGIPQSRRCSSEKRTFSKTHQSTLESFELQRTSCHAFLFVVYFVVYKVVFFTRETTQKRIPCEFLPRALVNKAENRRGNWKFSCFIQKRFLINLRLSLAFHKQMLQGKKSVISISSCWYTKESKAQTKRNFEPIWSRQ